ncbi:MAG: hypothetical protein IJX48_02290 [Paludibacteraceae bacterium]|nr:hypothetical protein [Paludibacteraceae bacterium]
MFFLVRFTHVVGSLRSRKWLAVAHESGSLSLTKVARCRSRKWFRVAIVRALSTIIRRLRSPFVLSAPFFRDSAAIVRCFMYKLRAKD